jgi:hypothetical protein
MISGSLQLDGPIGGGVQQDVIEIPHAVASLRQAKDGEWPAPIRRAKRD